jgi:hypothetical protein
MRAHKIRQRDLFDDEPVVAGPVLTEELRDELLQLLTQWLYTLSKRMAQENRDE